MKNKVIMISVKPKECANILKLIQSILVRKSFPKDYVGWVYIYCTKGKRKRKGSVDWYALDKVVAKFWCDKVYDIEVEENDSNGNYSDTYIYCDIPDLEDQSCLDFDDIVEYLWNYDKWGGKGYAIHISKLKVFEDPKKLGDFKVKGFERVKVLGSPYGDLDSVTYHYQKKPILKPLEKAPKNYRYVEVK